jgi:D-alanine--poly(phosphoribitol) ligase subunit 1
MEILKQVKKYSLVDRIAIKCDGNSMSYNELNKYSEAFAAFLLKEYKDDKTPILIYGNKENLIIVCMLAALKSGRAYIPIDTTYPKERVEAIQEEVKSKVLINFSHEESFEDIEVINNEILLSVIKEYEGIEVSEGNWVKDDENAYILFTSGSTGKPKGVQISKNNIDSFTYWFRDYLKLDERNEVILNQVSYSFDVSVIPIYIGLMTGKTLFSLSKTTLEEYRRLFSALEESNISYWVSTPALAEICINDDKFSKELIPDIKQMFFAGEVLAKKLCRELFKRFGEDTPINPIIDAYDVNPATLHKISGVIDIAKKSQYIYLFSVFFLINKYKYITADSPTRKAKNKYRPVPLPIISKIIIAEDKSP